jgi:hypothetical protein
VPTLAEIRALLDEKRFKEPYEPEKAKWCVLHGHTTLYPFSEPLLNHLSYRDIVDNPMQTLDFFFPKEHVFSNFRPDLKAFLTEHRIPYFLYLEEKEDYRDHEGDDHIGVTEMFVSFHLLLSIPDPSMAAFFKLSFAEIKPVEEWL